MFAPVRQSLNSKPSPSAGPLEKVLGALSIVTMLATVPQVVKVWTALDVSGVSLVSWVTYLVAACLWFVHGIQKHDRSIYLACIGWIVLDAAVVIGLIVRQT